jgi:STE24 endopeptidase
MIATVVFSSFLYLKLSNALLNIDMSTSEFVKELFKIITVMLILISPIICFGRVILFKKEISNPEIIAIAYILIPIIFLTLVNMIEFSPSLRKLKPITAQEILNALRQLESKLNVHIDNIYLLDRGLECTEVNAYQIGLKKFRIFITERLLSALKTEEVVGILAHEVAHAQRKHTLKIFLGSLFIVVIEITIVLLLLRKAKIVDALIIAFGAVWFIDILLRAVNRKFEYEADLIAARIVGRDVMISALKKMNKLSNSKEHSSKFSEILSDHPSIENRIKKLQNMKI